MEGKLPKAEREAGSDEELRGREENKEEGEEGLCLPQTQCTATALSPTHAVHRLLSSRN